MASTSMTNFVTIEADIVSIDRVLFNQLPYKTLLLKNDGLNFYQEAVAKLVNLKVELISRAERDISDIMFNTRNKSGIFAHPCIILYLF